MHESAPLRLRVEAALHAHPVLAQLGVGAVPGLVVAERREQRGLAGELAQLHCGHRAAARRAPRTFRPRARSRPAAARAAPPRTRTTRRGPPPLRASRGSLSRPGASVPPPMEDPLRIGRHAEVPLSEVELRTSRSSGPGGQHANVTASRVEAVFDVCSSRALSDEQRERISVAPRPGRARGRAGHAQPGAQPRAGARAAARPPRERAHGAAAAARHQAYGRVAAQARGVEAPPRRAEAAAARRPEL